jgi:hypothetical protein
LSELAVLDWHRFGETEAAWEELLHSAQELEEEAGQPQPHEASGKPSRELLSQGVEREGSPGVGGGACGGVQHLADLATEWGITYFPMH